MIAVSACLLGHKVRYDGKHKLDRLVTDVLAREFTLLPICPEADAGLGVPRPKIQLTRIGQEIRLRGVDVTELDVTARIRDQALHFIKHHPVQGIVLKDKSPSCGMKNARMVNTQGQEIGFANGLFVDTVLKFKAHLPLIQASAMQDPEQLENFINRVKSYCL